MIHGEGFSILDEFFEQSSVDLGSSSDVVGLTTGPVSAVNINCQPTLLESTVIPSIPCASTAPQHPPSTAALNAIFSESSVVLNADLTAANTATPRSGCSTEEFDSASLSTSLTRYTLAEGDGVDGELPTFIKRSTLDCPAPWLEHVLTALDMADTSRRPDSSVPGVLDDILVKGDLALCLKIMTSIAENYVKCSRCISRPTFDETQEIYREVDRRKGRLHIRGPILEYAPRHSNQNSSRDETARLGIRALVEAEMQQVLSEPKDLTGEFTEESDYEIVIKYIEKETANNAKTRLRRLWKEPYYWPMIQRRAKAIGPLPNPSDRKTEITPQEKSAAKQLIAAMGYGQSRDSVFKWTAYLKLLSQLRDEGATALLLYRTYEFRSHFFQHPKELDLLLSWSRVYDFPLRQLGARTLAEEGNDFSGKSDIEEKWIFDRLHAPQNLCWGDHQRVGD
jgi:hypothetical protein